MLGSRIAQGREAEVYDWDDGLAVLKLYRAGFGGHVTEAAALAALDGMQVAPGLLDTARIDGRDGLVLQRVGGVDMLASLQRQPWRLVVLARMLARAATRIHGVRAPEGIPDLISVLAERITSVDLEPQLRGFALRRLETLPAGDRLCHGDLHPGNAIVTGDEAAIVDWSAATRGEPAADFARSLLLLRWADPLPGTPMVLRVLMAAARSLYADEFARAYRSANSETPRDLDSWTVVHAAARLAEGITSERARLVGMVESAYHRRR